VHRGYLKCPIPNQHTVLLTLTYSLKIVYTSTEVLNYSKNFKQHNNIKTVVRFHFRKGVCTHTERYINLNYVK
jgi:hypothetical protein